MDNDEIVKENFANIFTKSKRTIINKEMIENLEKKFYANEKVEIKGKTRIQRKKAIKRNYLNIKSEADSENVISEIKPTKVSKKKMIIDDDEDDEEYE
jgi:hypothetical protein